MKKLKVLIIAILVVSLGLLGGVVGIIMKSNNTNTIDDTTTQEEIIENTYVGTITNNENVPEEIIDLIIDYNDTYYRSISELVEYDTNVYFSNAIAGAISDYAIKLTIESRKLYDSDFSLSNASYDLDFTYYYSDGEYYYVDFLMNEYLNFACLNDITSKSYDIENYVLIKKTDDGYKIEDYEKVQGYYVMFYDDNYYSVEEVKDTYDYYYESLSNTINYENKLKSQSEAYVSDKTYDVAYDRDKAVAYANKYYHARNNDWYDFSDEGGNCQSYASQCLLAGGMLMDYTGQQQWKSYDSSSNYDPGIDESQTQNGRSASFVQVFYFNDYCNENSGSGLVTDINDNIYYAEPGDIIQVGISSLTHTTIVTDVVDGHILLNSNSIDMVNWPLEAYTYPTRQLIKILGSNY